MTERVEVVVVGAGQAGLAMSWCLRERSVDHVVLERGQVAQRWRSERWDSLTFQFPNWSLSLPGYVYDGPDPDGFVHSAQVVQRIETYAALQLAPVREHTEVLAAVPEPGGGWLVTTTDGSIRCTAVVAATGPFQQPSVPALATRLPPWLTQVHSSRYRNPDQLPAGGVLVVGSGGSGAQIAEELLEAGRPVYLAVNRHRRVPRRLGDRDVLWWLLQLGVMDRTKDDWPDGQMPPTVLVTGAHGGHDLDLHCLRAAGARLVGRVQGVDGDTIEFRDDAQSIETAADVAYVDFLAAARAYATRHGMDVPQDPGPAAGPPPPFIPRIDLKAEGITAIVWCTGYRLDFGWIRGPLLDDHGSPLQRRGITPLPGLYLLGLHWMHTFKSGVFFGVGDDAEYIAEHIQSHVLHRAHP